MLSITNFQKIKAVHKVQVTKKKVQIYWAYHEKLPQK